MWTFHPVSFYKGLPKNTHPRPPGPNLQSFLCLSHIIILFSTETRTVCLVKVNYHCWPSPPAAASRKTLGFGKWMRVISEADGLLGPGAVFLLRAQMVMVNSTSLGDFYRPFCTLLGAWSSRFYLTPLHPLSSFHMRAYLTLRDHKTTCNENRPDSAS